jgi:septum formation protein
VGIAGFKSFYRRLDSGTGGSFAGNSDLCSSVWMVAFGVVFFNCHHHSFNLGFAQIVHSKHYYTVSPIEYGNKAGHVGGYSFNGFLLIFLDKQMEKIILASGSPRRKQLLELADISFEVIVAATDETYPPGLSFAQTAIYIAENKAMAVQNKLKEKYNGDAQTIIAADTVVVLENKILGKPQNSEDAIAILSNLSGKSHQVITGVCILTPENKLLFSEETEVEFYSLTAPQIEYYIAHYKPYDKAGAYAIQEWIGAIGIKGIKGDFYNVMGLPISRVVKELNLLQQKNK